MRNRFSLSVLSAFVMVSTFLASCHKEVTAPPKLNDDLGESKSVNDWLDQRKNPVQPNKAATIELLKNNLDFSGLKYEQLTNDFQLMIIPIKEDFKTQKKIEKNSLLNLVFVLDKLGNIKQGQIAIYTPESGKTLNKIPENTFHKVLNIEPIDISGKFQFLSVTGTRKQQYEYENGKIKSFGNVQQKTSAIGETGLNSTSSTDCTAWYLVTTYFVNGVPVFETSEFLGVTCESTGGGCDDPSVQSICPDGGGGGGGGGGSADPGDVVITTNESSTIEVADPTNGSNGTAPTIDYIYPSTITRINGIVTYAVAHPTEIGNPIESYVDQFGRNTTRVVSTLGHLDFATTGSTTSLCSWSCYVVGLWTYTDGSPQYPYQWTDSHMAVR